MTTHYTHKPKTKIIVKTEQTFKYLSYYEHSDLLRLEQDIRAASKILETLQKKHDILTGKKKKVFKRPKFRTFEEAEEDETADTEDDGSG